MTMHVMIADLPREEEVYDISYPNLGILYLISSLRERFSSRLKITYLEGFCDLKEHCDAIEKLKPDLYGLSFTSITSQLAYKTIAAVRERFPELTIVGGGPHPTAYYSHVFDNCPIDVCVIGEGEITFCDLVDYYLNGKERDINEISGIAYRENNTVHLTKPRRLVENIEDIPHPAWDIIDFSKYSGMHFRKADPQTYILVSRGCPFDCNFCSNPIWKLSKPWVRMREPVGIASEVKTLYDLGLRELYLSADEFNITIPWAIEVANTLADLNLDIFYQCNVRADKINDELAAAFARMGIWLVHIGIESGNQHVLDGIGKKVTIDQIRNASAILRRHGIKVFGFFMLYHAWEENGELHYEKPEDVKRTLNFAKELFRKDLINYMSWHVATPLPGSRLWNLAKKYGLLKSEEVFLDTREMAMTLPGISRRDIEKSLRYGYLLKIWQALKTGSINWRHFWRAKEVLKVVFGTKRSRLD